MRVLSADDAEVVQGQRAGDESASMQARELHGLCGDWPPWLTAVSGALPSPSPRDCIQSSKLNFLCPCLPPDKTCVGDTFFET